MKLNVGKEVAALRRMTMDELQAKYAERFGEEAWTINNRVWLVKRIAWRMQAQAEGDLSERARQRAAELANDADLRLSPPRPARIARDPVVRVHPAARRTKKDSPHLRPGTILARKHRGEMLEVRVVSQGFEFEGVNYPSLSAVAKAITGSHCSGQRFFRLTAIPFVEGTTGGESLPSLNTQFSNTAHVDGKTRLWHLRRTVLRLTEKGGGR